MFFFFFFPDLLNTLRTDDADLRLYAYKQFKYPVPNVLERRYQPKWKWVVSLDGMKLQSTKSIIIHRNNQKVVTHHL
jgi:hypothetical protein